MVGELPRFASLQLEAGERPLERLGRVVALRDEGLGALAQVRDGAMAGVAQDTARVDAKQQFDLVDPTGVQGREVKDEAPPVPGVEVVPHRLRAVRVQVVPYD